MPLRKLTFTSLPRVLRLSIGLPFLSAAYKCPAYGADADAAGIHSACCQRSGQIIRTHTALRDVVVKLLQESGYAVMLEVAVPGSPERPADFRGCSPGGKTGCSLNGSRTA